MIQSISIYNFKNLSGLGISSFSRVNLISGKNNVGKSALLEALELHISNSGLFSILERRGEEYARHSARIGVDAQKRNHEALSSLFTGRNGSTDGSNSMSINDGEHTFAARFVRYLFQTEETDDGTIRKRLVLSASDEANYTGEDVKVGLEISRDRSKTVLPLDRSLYGFDLEARRADIARCVYVKPNFNENDYVSKFWDNIALTDKEQHVIKALQIVDSNIENLAFLESSAVRGRYPVVKIKGENRRLPLRSLGDGLNHILSIILAVVNCENGCVLIDEIDNGLHYSVQKQLWTAIFELAMALNVQVFATTHSSDCISSFGKVLAIGDNANVGRYLRLECKGGEIKAVDYDASELGIIASQNIEVR